MMSLALRRISALGLVTRHLAASATACFVFTRGFQTIAMDEENSDAESHAHRGGTSPNVLAGIGAAIFLLIFVTSEALAAVVALRH